MTKQIDLEQQALNSLLAWESARQHLNALIAERNAHRCSEACDGDHATGDMGQGPCWSGGGDVSGMCEACQQREALMPDIIAAKKERSRLRQKMQRHAAKLLPFPVKAVA